VEDLAMPALLMAILMVGQLTGIGLDWNQGVFVQEYWQAGKPHYAIANSGNAAASISVYEAQTGKKLAGPWNIAPKRVISADAAKLQEQGLLEFRLGSGMPLGLLDAPRAPAGPSMESGKIVTTGGLNGSGGRQNELWFEQGSRAFKPESMVTLELVVRPGIGEILYSRDKLTELDVTCDTLPVKSSRGNFIIDTDHPAQSRMHHRIYLRFKTPKTDQPMIMVVDGWRWIVVGKNGHGLTRGIIVDPSSGRP
jgi:hypothetical protein